MKIYEGIGKNAGKLIEGSADALALAFEMYGIEPTEGYHNLDPEFVKEIVPEILDLFYETDWIIWDNEEEYLTAKGVA